MAQDVVPTVVIAGESADGSLVARLNDSRYRIETCGWCFDASATNPVAVILVDGGLDPAQALSLCRSLRTRLGSDRPPIVFLAADAVAIRQQAFDHGADACLVRPFSIDEVRGQILTLLHWHDSASRMRNRADELHLSHERLQQAYSQINLDLELASRLQASFLPRKLPEVGHGRLAVWSKPHGPVGGDFYDAFRLDERHIGFYLADAMGHGVPASLLAIFLKKAVTPKEIQSGGYRLLPPDEVLTRLNRDLIEQDLPDQPFVTMVYGLFNCFSGELSLARAAHPHPIYLPASGSPIVWQIPGTLLGVFESKYLTEKKTLAQGNRLLLTTDGFAAASADASAQDHEALMQAATKLRSLPLQEFVNQIADEMGGQSEPKDDWTLLALEMAR